jgi:hypothetical protein
MNPKLIRLLAVAATVLVVVSGVNRLMRPQVVSEPAPKKKSVAANTGKQADIPCTIKRAPFGGTQASLIKVMKGKMAHYIVMDHPGGNPAVPFYQRDWLEATYGEAEPVVMGQFSSVESAVTRAASLCKRN